MSATTHEPPTIEDSRTMRLVAGGTPHVYAAGDAVILQCSSEQAEVLAAVLAHYDVLTAASPSTALRSWANDQVVRQLEEPSRVAADGYRPGIWLHTLVELRVTAERVKTLAAASRP